ncbi:MAG: pyruvate synthase [Nitrososphaeria archaeon]|nr:pyruvate synthase [Nitrososphaeria archaeon]NIN53400.1 pyruvate synthase [Nitrososphaeria archaeon]NIQ33912.1 pyruvate synthase [Nitrososphaeria archaeon]
MKTLIEVRWHGRGGQGVVTVSELLARAALHEGKYVQAFPEFGPERMGAPIRAFTRICDKYIDTHSSVYNPDIVIVIDPTLLGQVNVTEGLPKGGALIINSKEEASTLKKELDADDLRVYTVDATRIALDELGRAFFNTPMLGTLLRVTDLVSMDSVVKVTRERFSGSLGERNLKAIKRAFEEVSGG